MRAGTCCESRVRFAARSTTPPPPGSGSSRACWLSTACSPWATKAPTVATTTWWQHRSRAGTNPSGRRSTTASTPGSAGPASACSRSSSNGRSSVRSAAIRARSPNSPKPSKPSSTSNTDHDETGSLKQETGTFSISPCSTSDLRSSARTFIRSSRPDQALDAREADVVAVGKDALAGSSLVSGHDGGSGLLGKTAVQRPNGVVSGCGLGARIPVWSG